MTHPRMFVLTGRDYSLSHSLVSEKPRRWLGRLAGVVVGFMLAVVGAASVAWADDANDCHPSDAPDVAGSGLSGMIDSKPAEASTGTKTLYEQYGWSGMQWSTCNLDDPLPSSVLPGVGDAVKMWNDRPDMTKNLEAWADTTVGNLFMGGATLLGATMTQLDEWVGTPSTLLGPVDESLDTASDAVVTALWGGTNGVGLGAVVVVGAAVMIVWWARAGDVRKAGATVVAVCVAALAMGALTASWPVEVNTQHGVDVEYHAGSVAMGRLFDHTASDIVGSVNAAQLNQSTTTTIPPNTAYGATLYDKILVPLWVQGAVGPNAGDITDDTSLAYAIFTANTSPWGQTQTDSKYQTIAKCLTGQESEKVCKAINTSVSDVQYHQLQGKSLGRSGIGFMAFAAMLVIAVIRIPCLILTLMGLVVIRFVVMFIPIWAIFGVIPATRPTAVAAGKMVLAAVYNMTVFGIIGAVHTAIVGAIVRSRTDGFTFQTLVILLILTGVTWVVTKPFRSVTVPATGDMLGDSGQNVGQFARGWRHRIAAPVRWAGRFGSTYLANKWANERNTPQSVPDMPPELPPQPPADPPGTTTYDMPAPTPREPDVKLSWKSPVTKVQAPIKRRPSITWERQEDGRMVPRAQIPLEVQKPFEFQSPIEFRDRNYQPPEKPSASTWTPPGPERDRAEWEELLARVRQPQEPWPGPDGATSTTGTPITVIPETSSGAPNSTPSSGQQRHRPSGQRHRLRSGRTKRF